MKEINVVSLHKPALLWKEFTQHTFFQFYASLHKYYKFMKDLQETHAWRTIAGTLADSFGRDSYAGTYLHLLGEVDTNPLNDERLRRLARVFGGAYDSLSKFKVSIADVKWWNYEKQGPLHPEYCDCALCDYASWLGFRYTATRLTRLPRTAGLVFSALVYSRPDWLQEALVWQWCYNLCSAHNGLDFWASRAFSNISEYRGLNLVLRHGDGGFNGFWRACMGESEPFTYLGLSAEQTEHLLRHSPLQAFHPCPYNPIGKETLIIRNEDAAEVPF